MSVSFPLSLRPLQSQAHKPAAWFIPGARPAAWVDELALWQVPLSELHFYVVPTSVCDRRAIGVLVVDPGGLPLSVSAQSRARAYGRLADRLYLPADAVLEPPVSDEELRVQLHWKVCVLHPSAGLVGFTEDDALHLHDLLALPPRQDANWDRAIPGAPPPPRLTSVEPDLPQITIQMMLDEGRGDIGTEAPDELPPAPSESKVGEAMSKVVAPGLNAISWLASHVPGVGAGSAWLNQLHGWAREKLDGINASLAAARHRELTRLQEMLRSDPDKGLRYAIPMSGLDRSRGAAPPGARLTPRDVNFNLRRLGGGGRGDAWHVPWDLQQQLLAQYREAANRELALGRFRRAAYVFAELLGDFASAANALRQGRHYREAALLYREKLNNPTAAAECLEQGGLLIEAVALYEELRMHEKAAGLYERLERPEDAARCYRAAVDNAYAAGRFVDASRLLETKLAAPDEALGLLDAAWPEDDAAGGCLREWFDLLGRLGRHEQASRRLTALRADAALPPPRTAAAAQVIGNVATSYPDAGTRTLAADAARIVVGRRLPHAPSSEATALLEVITRLAPHDRLLRRDGNRYLTRRRGPRPPAPPPQAPGKGPFLMHQFRLPEHVEWKRFSAAGAGFFGYGEVSSGLFLVRGRWDGMVQGMYWTREPGVSDYVVEPFPDGRTLLVLPLGVAPQARALQFPSTDAFRDSAAATTPASIPQGLIRGACVDQGGVAWVASVGSHGSYLTALRADGSLASTRALNLGGDVSEESGASIHMAARNGHVFLAAGRWLAHVTPAGTAREESLPRPARSMVSAEPFTRVRVAVAMEEAGLVCWDDGDVRAFAEGMPAPAVAFTRGGALVAVSATLGRVYRGEGKALKLQSSFATFNANQSPVAVTATDQLNHFATFGADGLVRVFQLGS